jgi:hypothetical protein
MVEIGDHLHASGTTPVLFYQSKKFPFGDRPFQRVQVDTLLGSAPEYFASIGEKISAACLTDAPGIFIEDTYPSRLQLHPGIAKFLVVRPTSFSYLLSLRTRYGNTYEGYLMADAGGSPTWPYTPEETATIRNWKEFHEVGPIFRRATPAGIKKLQQKYGWQEDVPQFVFSMGGGGQHEGANDVGNFLEQSAALAPKIRERYPQARLLFVKGPLYPVDAPVPQGFEIVAAEEDMPSLFAIATMAVIRPGFNSIWECIYGQTPFYYVEGTTYSEPINEKINVLKAQGLASNEEALDEDYHRRFRKACQAVLDRWNGRPTEVFMQVIEQGSRQATQRYREAAGDTNHTS